jgi:alkanesulfonate monooxygenase SsuD/methylene tetrahydromethanopterin reductase-like flavin-dependent oxidoreductase (luciferase family)
MQFNAFFPTRDIGSDPAKIRAWAQAAENLGYAYIEVPDHVFGVTARNGWVPVYNEKDPFHETFVTLGFLAAVTKNIRLSNSDRAAAPNRNRREASGGGRSPEWWALEAWHRCRLEPC